MRPETFVDGVLDRYAQLQAPSVAKSAAFTASSGLRESLVPRVGHPISAGLGLGETTTAQMAIAFLDLRAFTRRSFWQPLQEVTRLSMAVLGQVAEVVEESGGSVLGLRGDGLMAGWGASGSDPTVDVAMAMAACAFSLDVVRNALNQALAFDNIEPVQLVAGADHGEVCFAGTGTAVASEVNIVGFPANFAAKCEKAALSWEVVVGEGAASYINSGLLTRHPDSPKRYTQGGNSRSYEFHQFAWTRILPDAASAIAQTAGQPTSSISITWKDLTR